MRASFALAALALLAIAVPASAAKRSPAEANLVSAWSQTSCERPWWGKRARSPSRPEVFVLSAYCNRDGVVRQQFVRIDAASGQVDVRPSPHDIEGLRIGADGALTWYRIGGVDTRKLERWRLASWDAEPEQTGAIPLDFNPHSLRVLPGDSCDWLSMPVLVSDSELSPAIAYVAARGEPFERSTRLGPLGWPLYWSHADRAFVVNMAPRLRGRGKPTGPDLALIDCDGQARALPTELKAAIEQTWSESNVYEARSEDGLVLAGLRSDDGAYNRLGFYRPGAGWTFRGPFNHKCEPMVVSYPDIEDVCRSDSVGWLGFSPSGRRLAVTKESVVEILDATSLEPLHRYKRKEMIRKRAHIPRASMFLDDDRILSIWEGGAEVIDLRELSEEPSSRRGD